MFAVYISIVSRNHVSKLTFKERQVCCHSVLTAQFIYLACARVESGIK